MKVRVAAGKLAIRPQQKTIRHASATSEQWTKQTNHHANDDACLLFSGLVGSSITAVAARKSERKGFTENVAVRPLSLVLRLLLLLPNSSSSSLSSPCSNRWYSVSSVCSSSCNALSVLASDPCLMATPTMEASAKWAISCV